LQFIGVTFINAAIIFVLMRNCPTPWIKLGQFHIFVTSTTPTLGKLFVLFKDSIGCAIVYCTYFISKKRSCERSRPTDLENYGKKHLSNIVYSYQYSFIQFPDVAAQARRNEHDLEINLSQRTMENVKI
jgi:hypothetical protein